MVSDMQVYLPNGDIAFGGATPANVAALEAANYRVTVVDDMGKATGAVPFPPAAGNS